MNRGLIHLYIGKGKGKTTAACGLTLRAHGAGRKACFVRFLKPRPSSEILMLKRLKIDVVSFKEKHPFFYKAASIEALRDKVLRDIKKTEKIIRDRNYNFIVLDELLYLYSEKLISEHDIVRLIGLKPKDTELVITGVSATKTMIKLADYVSTIDDTKHPFKRGIKARPGIEF